MEINLLAPEAWAQAQFGLAQLGDERRQKRLVKVAAQLARQPGGTLPQAFPQWAELKAAYRFFQQRGVNFENILAPHTESVRQSCRAAGEYLLIEDTTLLDFSVHPATRGLATIGNGRGRGFELHSTLAVRLGGAVLPRLEGELLGLFDQQCRRPTRALPGETRRELLSRPRASQKWLRALRRGGGPPPEARWIFLADREADCYETLHNCQQHGVDFVLRSCHDRRLAAGAGHLRATVAAGVVLGEMQVEIRSRGGQPARWATVQVRGVRASLDGTWRPGQRPPPLADLGVVEVAERNPPAGVKEPLHWILLTSLACATWAEAQRVVRCYRARWWIEEYHKALKTGTGVEESQLEQADRLEALVAVLAVVAVRLLSAKMWARRHPQGAEAAQHLGPEMLRLLTLRQNLPKGGWTNENVIVAIARLGGFLARKNDGPPGWITLWRGWQRLIWMAEGAKLI